MPEASIPAAQRALAQAGLAIERMHALKTHNPFALNDILFARAMGVDLGRMNNYGCSLVWGHPQGPMGTRAIIELIEELSCGAARLHRLRRDIMRWSSCSRWGGVGMDLSDRKRHALSRPTVATASTRGDHLCRSLAQGPQRVGGARRAWRRARRRGRVARPQPSSGAGPAVRLRALRRDARAAQLAAHAPGACACAGELPAAHAVRRSGVRRARRCDRRSDRRRRSIADTDPRRTPAAVGTDSPVVLHVRFHGPRRRRAGRRAPWNAWRTHCTTDERRPRADDAPMFHVQDSTSRRRRRCAARR
jgi:hypothetical protein